MLNTYGHYGLPILNCRHLIDHHHGTINRCLYSFKVITKVIDYRSHILPFLNLVSYCLRRSEKACGCATLAAL